MQLIAVALFVAAGLIVLFDAPPVPVAIGTIGACALARRNAQRPPAT